MQLNMNVGRKVKAMFLEGKENFSKRKLLELELSRTWELNLIQKKTAKGKP